MTVTATDMITIGSCGTPDPHPPCAREVMAELFGKKTGCCRGQGGSMHIFSAKNNFLGGYAFIGEWIISRVGLIRFLGLLDQGMLQGNGALKGPQASTTLQNRCRGGCVPHTNKPHAHPNGSQCVAAKHNHHPGQCNYLCAC
jgi:hypothetical protein